MEIRFQWVLAVANKINSQHPVSSIYLFFITAHPPHNKVWLLSKQIIAVFFNDKDWWHFNKIFKKEQCRTQFFQLTPQKQKQQENQDKNLPAKLLSP